MPWVDTTRFLAAPFRTRGTGLLIPAGASLRFTLYPGAAAATVNFTALILDETNNIQQAGASVVAPASGGVTTRTVPISPGILVAAAAAPVGWTPIVGDTVVECSLVLSTSPTAFPIAHFGRSWLTPSGASLFPATDGTPDRGASAPIKAMSAPGPSTDFSTVYGNTLWKPDQILSVQMTITTSAVVANRRAGFTLTSAGTDLAIVRATTTQAAGTAVTYRFQAATLAANTTSLAQFEPLGILGAQNPWGMTLDLDNAQAADEWSDYTLTARTRPTNL